MSDHGSIGSTVAGRYGAAGAAQLSLREATIAAAWNVQGKPDNPAFLEQVRSSFGVALPLAPNTTAATDTITALWLGPESWLLVAGGPLAPGHPLTDFTARRDALNAAGGAVFDVTMGRVAWTLAGARAATVLGSGCPLDFDARVFAPGTCAQSLFGHVNALYCRHAGGDFTMFVARSFARDMWATLCGASAQHGYEVRAPAPFR